MVVERRGNMGVSSVSVRRVVGLRTVLPIEPGLSI
jgi:hypothetical protein